MAIAVGKRFVAGSGAEVIVTKGSSGDLADADQPLLPKEEAEEGPPTADPRQEPVIQLGKRYRSADGEVELLVIKAGVCDLRHDAQPMDVVQPKVLPSAD